MSSVWASRAITPDRTCERVRLIAESGQIVELVSDVDADPQDDAFPDCTLVPGLVDLQVNGGKGGAYDAPDPNSHACATQFHLVSGTTSLLATLVSASIDRLEASLSRLAPEIDPAGPVVGVHLEGPFLSEAKSGAHDRQFLCDPTPEAVTRLVESAQGTLRLVTLAPERPGALAAIRRFVESGAVIAAGHSSATSAELQAAIVHGLSFITHLGNASDWPSRPFDPAIGYRRSEPGLIGTFLFEQRLRASLILDGLHLHPELARALIEFRGPENVALVSDATPAAGLPPGRYRVGGLEAEIRPEGHAIVGDGLAGSVIPLHKALCVAVREAGLTLQSAVRMATATPASVIGIDGRKGSLEPGHDADLLLLDPDLGVQAVYRAGKPISGQSPA
jgi:N-acetylglucosamine-6-phosphate deacetylase